LNDGTLLLAVDTCGASGSIALGRLAGGDFVRLGEAAFAGGELSVALVQGIADLLAAAGMTGGDLGGLVVVAGPGSFTGIRIGLAAVKALAEAGGLPVVAISRLALLAKEAGTSCAVLDAHRGQIYCGFYPENEAPREMLLTAGELNAMGGLAGAVGVCEELVAQLLGTLVGEPQLVRVGSMTAFSALQFSLSRWQAGEFAEAAALDGYYLRGADAKVSSKRGS
jgi:tRNA threonylcarbamoyladenosine biosynthesis protein TsaB